MKQYQETLRVGARGQGLFEFTADAVQAVDRAEVTTGLATFFIQHTSASLTIQENADPSARRDMEYFLNKLVPENDPGYTHTHEGPDDMPAHLKTILTSVSLNIPVVAGRLALGTWQGIYLWEHRYHAGPRKVIVHVTGA